MIRLLKRVLNCIQNPPNAREGHKNRTFRKVTKIMLEKLMESFDDKLHPSSFGQGDVVIHFRSEGVYRILLDPRCGLTLEGTNEPAYAYVTAETDKQKVVWVRSAAEFEDGRFKMLRPSDRDDPWPAWTNGQENTIPWRS